MAMPTREVKVGEHTYKFYLIGGSKAFKASREFTAKLATLVPCMWAEKTEELNAKLLDLVMGDFDNLFETFIDKNQIWCDGHLIPDFDEHFAGRFTDIPKLLYKVIMENDKDFFHYLPTLIERGLHKVNERLQANSLPKAEGLETALTGIAKNLKENLG